MITHTREHEDGTTCLEGTSSVPAGYSPCCATFGGHVETCVYDLRYEWWPRQRCWVIAVAENAGGGGIMIRYCPHCGHDLRRAAARKTPVALLIERVTHTAAMGSQAMLRTSRAQPGRKRRPLKDR